MNSFKVSLSAPKPELEERPHQGQGRISCLQFSRVHAVTRAETGIVVAGTGSAGVTEKIKTQPSSGSRLEATVEANWKETNARL